jgi:serine phosphatase RsbU (regulator of sigma subunit)
MSAPHRLRRVYAVSLGILAVAAVAMRLAAPDSDAAILALVLALLGAFPVVAWGARWVWRKLTYRVGVRLFISYLLIGLTPFALFACLVLVAGYVLVGQYAASRVASETEQVATAMAARAAAAVREVALGRVKNAREMVENGGSEPENGLHEEWLLADESHESRSPGAAALPVPRWVGESGWRGPVVEGGAAYLAAVERHGDALAAVLLPLDLENARAFAPGTWYEVRFVTSLRTTLEGKGEHEATMTVGGKAGEPSAVRVDGQPVPETEMESGWLSARPQNGNWWQRARLNWVWLGATPRVLETGKEATRTLVVTLIKLSPKGAVAELFGPSDRLTGEVKTMFTVMAAVFGTVYLIAVGFAAVMILRVTRATARLSRGARALAGGKLDHRIPVTRHDQLGDLAGSFNTMAESVRTMLAQVAESERMTREVELAREIQASLLPPREFSSGPLSVWTHFRPAAEVGGDYFDLFPLEPGRLMVSIGDVAGHGLSTGLLMAMVKSAVAALVEEGYRGGELLARLNHLLLAQTLKQRMVSFALAEVDTGRKEVAIASAGHQPGVLLAADGGVEEILLSSLPLGHRWPDPPPERTLPFEAGGHLLLYSDGLVEARNGSGAPFGYERLQDALIASRDASGLELLTALLSELDRHLAGQPLGDDLTVVLVEHRPKSR